MSSCILIIFILVKRFVNEGKLPHLLLYGPPGTGKTSTAVALANTIFGPNHAGQVLELNASDERGIDVVREQIKTFAGTRNLFATSKDAAKTSFKLVILDESDAMTSTAQNALRRVMEKYVKHVRFILICNYASQLIPAIQSRCTRFRFSPIGKEGCMTRLNKIIEAENVNVSASAKNALIDLSKGDMRRVLNVLQAAASTVKTGELIDEPLIYAVTATPHPSELDRILDVLLNSSNFESMLSSLRKIQEHHALAMQDIVGCVFERINGLQLPPLMRINLTKQLADLEYRLTLGTNESIQLHSLVGIFLTSRCLMDKKI